MVQTRIDQFYKVINNKQKSEKNNSRELSSFNRTVGKKKGKQFLGELKTTEDKNRKQSPLSKSKVQSLNKANKGQMMQNDISLDSKASSSKIYAKNSPTKVINARTITSPITEHTSPVRTQQRTPVSHSNSKFTPKTSSPIKNALYKSPEGTRIARRKLFKDSTDELISATIDNLNLAKEGAISDNDIDLEKVYSSGKFNYKYNPIDTTVSTRYEINDVVVPTEMYSLHLFLVIVNVFSNPNNCGYFDIDELDLVFSLLTISKEAQALLIRMIKRKHAWHRINSIKYDMISTDLKPVFDELVSRSILKNNTEEEDISVLLNLLQVDEIRKLCHESKINGSRKKNYIQSILKFCSETKSLFPGMTSPAVKLRASVNRHLGYCVLLDTRVKCIIDKIITLLIPNRDPTETLADVFLTLLRVETNQIKFPKAAMSSFPIFASKGHLLNYIEAKSVLSDVLSAIEKKQWDTVRDLGSLAAQRLPFFLEVETESLQDSVLPHHIRCFMPSYTWLKVLSKSIDAFKKTKETMPQAIGFLRTLIGQDCHMKNRKGQWYGELIKIEMYHRKNLDESVTLLSDAVSYENLTEVDRLDLFERAEMLVKRKSGISQHGKDSVKQILDTELSRARLMFQTTTVTKEGMLCGNALQRKTVWCINNGTEEQTYGSVESLALYDYKREGYSKGMHCEGAFPMTLFGMLFWDEIYDMNIPGACVSLYQEAPLDLFSPEFYENRKERIDMKLQIMRKFDAETLSRHLKYEYDLRCEYNKSIFVSEGVTFDNSNSLQEIAFCLGVEGVVGICERLIHNFALWKAGFPDLIVWNAHTKQYKIVEVKGPGDSLSTKQKLWLKYLTQLGLNTEVCHYEANTSHAKGGRKRKRDETVI